VVHLKPSSAVRVPGYRIGDDIGARRLRRSAIISGLLQARGQRTSRAARSNSNEMPPAGGSSHRHCPFPRRLRGRWYTDSPVMRPQVPPAEGAEWYRRYFEEVVLPRLMATPAQRGAPLMSGGERPEIKLVVNVLGLPSVLCARLRGASRPRPWSPTPTRCSRMPFCWSPVRRWTAGPTNLRNGNHLTGRWARAESSTGSPIGLEPITFGSGAIGLVDGAAWCRVV